MQEKLYEWVVLTGKQEYYLTQAQYEVLLRQQSNKFVVFEHFVINPAYISSMYKRPAKKIRAMYPCIVCESRGFLFQIIDDKAMHEECFNCHGTGMDFKKEPTLLLEE